MSISSNVVAAISHGFVNSGEGNNNKRDDEEEEIEQKLNLKKRKCYEPKNRSFFLKAFSYISYDEFITQTVIGEIGEAASPKPILSSTGASKTLIARNLPISIDKSHVIDFFKQIGDDIVDVRLHYKNGKDGERRAHFADIEFATEEAANKALKFHRLDLFSYTIRISRQLEGTNGETSKTRLVMKDIPYYTEICDVIKFFKLAGEVVDVRFSYNEDGEFSGSGHIEFATEEGAKKAERLNGIELLGVPVDLRREAKGTGASRTLCLKNVPLSIDKSHVIDFFENVGDIADVRFSYDEHGTFRGIVHVEFATEEAAEEAVKWNGRDLKGCPVELGIVREILCVQGFDTSLGIDQIWSFLKKHFKTIRSIVHMDIPTDRTTGVPLGTALIEFSTLQAFHRALDMDGQEVDGTSLTIKDHVPRQSFRRTFAGKKITF
ncbi:hypothetical protein MKW92_043565 [Papaver armeniacum]|nr:hypothetical protein MKW92_043565 [Papaver armeniacum]